MGKFRGRGRHGPNKVLAREQLLGSARGRGQIRRRVCAWPLHTCAKFRRQRTRERVAGIGGACLARLAGRSASRNVPPLVVARHAPSGFWRRNRRARRASLVFGPISSNFSYAAPLRFVAIDLVPTGFVLFLTVTCAFSWGRSAAGRPKKAERQFPHQGPRTARQMPRRVARSRRADAQADECSFGGVTTRGPAGATRPRSETSESRRNLTCNRLRNCVVARVRDGDLDGRDGEEACDVGSVATKVHRWGSGAAWDDFNVLEWCTASLP